MNICDQNELGLVWFYYHIYHMIINSEEWNAIDVIDTCLIYPL